MEFEYLRAIGQLLILISAIALYFTGKNIARLWSEMRIELITLRGLTQKYICNGSPDVLAGDVRSETGADLSNGDVGRDG